MNSSQWSQTILPFLENTVSLSSSFQPKPGSQISFTPVSTPHLHLHSLNTVPRTNLFVQQGYSMALRLLSCLYSHPIQTLTTGFCLTVPISFLSDSISEFLPLQSWFVLTTLSIVLAVSAPSSPESYTQSVPVLCLYNISIRSITPHQFLLPFS